MKLIQRYLNPSDAALALTVLEGNGIEAVLVDANTASTYPGLSFAGGGVGVAVDEDKIDEARTLLMQKNPGSPEVVAQAGRLMVRMSIGALLSAVVIAPMLYFFSARLRDQPGLIGVMSLLLGLLIGVLYASRKSA